MSRAARTVLLVGHDEATRARLEVRARLRGLEPVSCITGEAALTRAEAEPPFAVISALVLPGAGGLVVLAELERRWPGTHTVLLSDIPPGPSPQARARLAVDAILVRRGAWEPAVVQAALQVQVVDASLDAALDSGDPESVAALVRGAALDEAQEALALTHLAAAAPPQVALPILEEALSRSPPRPARFATALDVAAGLGEAGLEVVVRVAEAADAPPEVRGRAMRRVAATAPLPSVRACLEPLLTDPRLALDAADALMEAATAAGPEGFEVLRELCTTDATPESVRVAALGHLFEAFGRAEVAPVLSALTRAAPPALKAEASRLLARADEFSLEALVAAAEDPARPVAERKAALARAAADLPKAEALALLERAQVAEAPALALAGFELAASRADTDFEATFTRAARAGAGALQAVLLGIMKLGPRGAPALERLISAPWVPPTVRGQALRLLALRFPARIAAPKVQQSLQGEDEALHDAAVLAALQLGRTGWALLYSTLSSSTPPTARAAALAALDRHAPAELVQEALRRASRDPNPAVRWAAVRAAARRTGAEVARMLPALARAGDPTLFEAALDGARALGEAGFSGLAALATRPEVPTPTRRRALAVLAAEFTPDEVAPVLAAARLSPSEAAPAAAPRVAPGPAPVAAAWDTSAPARPALPRAEGLGPRVEAWEVADTRPTPPATDGAQEAPGAEGLGAAAAGGPALAAHGPGAGADAPGSTAGVRGAAAPGPAAGADAAGVLDPAAEAAGGGAPAAAGAEGAGQPMLSASEAPTQPAAPATAASAGQPAPGTGPRVARAARAGHPAPGSDQRAAHPAPAPHPTVSDLTPPAAGQPAPSPAEGTTWLPSGRVRPPSPQGARQISLRRASEALTSALRLGRDGYRGLRTLTESGRVPVQVRVQALRHLAADFGDRDVSPILERAMASDVPGLQNAALSAVMLRRDAALGPLVTLSTRPDVEVATRVRAVRFMASRFPKAETRASLEALLEAGDPDVRRAALEALFTSMRFVPPDQVEAGLVNILKEHHELEVRVSAARALGAFGGHQAQSALRWAAGFSGDGALKQAAREALERLKE